MSSKVLMDEKQLLNRLIEGGLLGKEDADRAAKQAAALGKSAEEVIYDLRLVAEEEVAKVKSQLLRIPWKKIDPTLLGDDLLKLIPGETAKNYRVVPLSLEKGTLIVGMVDPTNEGAKEALRFLAKEQKVSLGVYLVTPSDVELALRRYPFFIEDIKQAVQSLNIKPGKETISAFQRLVRLEEGLGTESNEAPVIRIVASMLKEAVNVGASDIHIEPQRKKMRVRFRVDGDLREVLTFPSELEQPIVSRVKVLSNLKIDEGRVPQDGRFRTTIFGREIDFRVATFPVPTGEKMAIRVLDSATGLKSLDEFGLLPVNMALIVKAIAKPYGMILLTGPTGSGKTTTLYALMQKLNTESVNILSLEDPVEYTIDGINQSQVKPEIGYDFASGLRQILRQDPNVIMVGEVRDRETAGLAVHAALTGHLVLSTLHTNNAIGVIPRLIDMGVEPFLLPSVLNLMASQRLVSRLCERCRKSKDPPSDVADLIARSIAKLPPKLRDEWKPPFKVFAAPGCTFCRGKGLVGRVALFEAFEMTPQFSDIIVGPGLNENKILDEAKRQGTIFLRQDGVIKALRGEVSIEEVLKETEEM